MGGGGVGEVYNVNINIQKAGNIYFPMKKINNKKPLNLNDNSS